MVGIAAGTRLSTERTYQSQKDAGGYRRCLRTRRWPLYPESWQRIRNGINLVGILFL